MYNVTMHKTVAGSTKKNYNNIPCTIMSRVEKTNHDLTANTYNRERSKCFSTLTSNLYCEAVTAVTITIEVDLSMVNIANCI